jgi:uridine kinase
MSFRPYIVGISGGSASGKSSFLAEIKRRLPEKSVCIVSQDNYYVAKELQHIDENGKINFDLPTSINRKAFYEDMLRLMRNEPVQISEYTFNNEERAPSTITMQPAPIIILEGLFIFHYDEIRQVLDLSIYIDALDEVKLSRRLKRDAEERGYPESEVLYQWHNHVLPSYYKYLRPYREDADIIVTNNKSYEKGLKVILDHLLKIAGDNQ